MRHERWKPKQELRPEEYEEKFGPDIAKLGSSLDQASTKEYNLTYQTR